MASYTLEKRNSDSNTPSKALIQPTNKLTETTVEGYEGTLIDNIFFPTCANCRSGIPARKWTLTPSFQKLTAALKKLKLHVALNRYYCTQKRDYVSFPKKCGNKRLIDLTESFMLYVRRQKWRKRSCQIKNRNLTSSEKS